MKQTIFTHNDLKRIKIIFETLSMHLTQVTHLKLFIINS